MLGACLRVRSLSVQLLSAAVSTRALACHIPVQVAKGLGPGSSDSLFHYGKDGFGEGPHQDHTSVEKR